MNLGGDYITAMNQAVAAVVDVGVVIVVAAGNKSSGACYSSPASEPLAITVGYTGISNWQLLFNSLGSCVDIYAGGSDLISSFVESSTAFKSLSGTSMASPYKLKKTNVTVLCLKPFIVRQQNINHNYHTF